MEPDNSQNEELDEHEDKCIVCQKVVIITNSLNEGRCQRCKRCICQKHCLLMYSHGKPVVSCLDLECKIKVSSNLNSSSFGCNVM